MKALTWHGSGKIQCDTVADPTIEEPHDIVVKVTSCAICGSDLHLMGGFIPHMEKGDILGHECMGEVVEKGSSVKNLKIGDRVVVPFNIACGKCRMCKNELYSCCERANRKKELQVEAYGYPLAGAFGFGHSAGGYSGGQAEYVRVPFADVGPLKVNNDLTDEQVLFLSDIFPTGYMAAENCDIQAGQTIAVFGCGPVAQFAIMSAFLLGAKSVIAIDTVPERLRMAKRNGAITVDFGKGKVQDQIRELTDGKGPDAVIDAVGLESHGAQGTMERVASAVKETLTSSERTYSLNEAILACRPAGIVSVPGVYGGEVGPVAMGAFMNKGLTMKTGQTSVRKYMPKLLKMVEDEKIDLTSVITHRSKKLEDGPDLYKTFRDKKDGCIKVVIHP